MVSCCCPCFLTLFFLHSFLSLISCSSLDLPWVAVPLGVSLLQCGSPTAIVPLSTPQHSVPPSKSHSQPCPQQCPLLRVSSCVCFSVPSCVSLWASSCLLPHLLFLFTHFPMCPLWSPLPSSATLTYPCWGSGTGDPLSGRGVGMEWVSAGCCRADGTERDEQWRGPWPLPHRAPRAPSPQPKPDSYAQKGVYHKKRGNPARWQPSPVPLMVQCLRVLCSCWASKANPSGWLANCSGLWFLFQLFPCAFCLIRGSKPGCFCSSLLAWELFAWYFPGSHPFGVGDIGFYFPLLPAPWSLLC